MIGTVGMVSKMLQALMEDDGWLARESDDGAMQTFLPYADFERCAAALDPRRLGKQRVEAWQILRVLRGESRGWRNHPAALMWRGYEDALGQYLNAMIAEWERRGYTNTMARYPLPEGVEIVAPPWLGDEALHASHRSNLLRKDATFYGRYGWSEPPDLPYVWPVRLERRGRVGDGSNDTQAGDTGWKAT